MDAAVVVIAMEDCIDEIFQAFGCSCKQIPKMSTVTQIIIELICEERRHVFWDFWIDLCNHEPKRHRK